MTMDQTEQRLVDALRSTERTEPSPDLWSRVLHSIEEDRAHRRRVAVAAAGGAACAVALAIVIALGTTDHLRGSQVRPPVMELVETAALVALVLVLGRAVARFGRGYATDLWPRAHDTASAIVRLLDLAYALVFGGYILLTAEFDTGWTNVYIAEQLQSMGYRIGGLLLMMGFLHGFTVMVLPVVALVSNSTRAGRKLPRWLVTALIVVAVPVGFILLLNVVGLIVGGAT